MLAFAASGLVLTAQAAHLQSTLDLRRLVALELHPHFHVEVLGANDPRLGAHDLRPLRRDADAFGLDLISRPLVCCQVRAMRGSTMERQQIQNYVCVILNHHKT